VIRWDNIAQQAHITDTTPFGLTDPGAGAELWPGPAAGTRADAIVMTAIYDAADAITQQYQMYVQQDPAPPDANFNAAVAQAGHDALLGLYPGQKPELDALLAEDLAKIHDGQGKTDGITVGQTAAANMLANRANDGAVAALNAPYTVNTAPGNWQPDPLHPTQKAYAPGWGDLPTFGILSATQFPAPPEPSLTSYAYTQAYNQVFSLGALYSTTRTADQTQIGTFWADESAGVGTPCVIYNMAYQTIAIQENSSLMQEARMFALTNIGLADGAIASWNSKYDFNFWRPITGIRDAAETGNQHTVADPYWQPLGSPADNPVYSGGATNFTPPWPSYVSGHGDIGTAAFQIIADLFGNNIHFTLHSPEFNGVTQDDTGVTRPELTRSYNSIPQAIFENAESRIYLGDHWQFDANAAVTMGVAIGNYDFTHLMQPINRGGADFASLPNSGIVALTAESSGPTSGPTLSNNGNQASPAGARTPGSEYFLLTTEGVPSQRSAPDVAHIPLHQNQEGGSSELLNGGEVRDLAFTMPQWWE
jgi:hypothetical protein